MPILNTTSATNGYLSPTTPPPATDQDLDQQLQALVVGITGLPGDLVRVRWQPEDELQGKATPRIPNQGKTWVAIGVTASSPDDSAALIHDGTGEGSSTLRRFETLECLASFYGPKSDGYAALFRDGLSVSQNREAIRRQGLDLTDIGATRRISDIANTVRRRRCDLPFRLNRVIERTYPILNLLEAAGVIHVEADSQGSAAPLDKPFDTKDVA